ncbi:TrmH family RNA methyltransferase [Thiothrix subterranea]|uniref:TrmH family RNA methyltransferase n=1 Tax=Thiothrix subterranea TaxID=2735563 RepID=UPI00280C3E19|nr:TrmH family RNA methyltransferase [Thiothrix subterranea]
MYTPALEHLCIVMVETSHPGNIGSAARAMKVMGIQDLRLVAPRKPYSQDTWALASGANDIIEQAKIVPTLQDAVADCHIVIWGQCAFRTYLAMAADGFKGMRRIRCRTFAAAENCAGLWARTQRLDQ